MSNRVALVTGAGGEMGRLLIPELIARGFTVAAVDLVALPQELQDSCVETIEASILDAGKMHGLVRRHRPTHVFHLAAVLSTKAEHDPELAHQVNVNGTLGMFRICQEEVTGLTAPIRFVFPSSIAAYGMPDSATKPSAGAVDESSFNTPSGMYGINKLYCEMVGTYLSHRTPGDRETALDFRSIRFPGLISAETMPSGGTTDYAPEMIHAAAQGKSYACFVREDTRLPFMTMPDAIEALLGLTAAPAESLSRRVYNIKGFAATAGEIRKEILRHYPGAELSFRPVEPRQALVDSWPADIDDGPARRDWGLAPRHGLAEAVGDYLVPALRRRYSGQTSPA